MTFSLGKHTIVHPIFQGGMGVGISGSRLAGTVAGYGGIGTLSAIGLPSTPAYKGREGFEFTDSATFIQASARCATNEVLEAKNIANKTALQRSIASSDAVRPGLVFMNVMAAIHGYREQVEAAMRAGVDGIVTGAGVPPDCLLEIAKDFPNVALVPILSTCKGVQMIIRSWERKGRLPDAIILEDPSCAGGHLGANGRKLENVDAPESLMEMAVPETKQFLGERGLKIPVIAAGGMVNRADIRRALNLGADGTQLGTRFLASQESGAHLRFKQAIVDSKKMADILVYQSSACLPARAIATSPIFERIKNRTAKKMQCCLKADCLQHCALRDGLEGFAQLCILSELARVTEGGDGEGLYFTGTSALRIPSVLSVQEIMAELIEK